MTEHTAPKRPAVRETVSRRAREAQESAKATASLAGSTAKASAAAASNTAKMTASSVSQKLPFDMPKVALPKVELPKFEIPTLDGVKRDVEKVAGKGAELALDAKKAIESTIVMVREAVGR